MYITCTVSENLQFFSPVSISNMQFSEGVGLISDTLLTGQQTIPLIKSVLEDLGIESI